MQIPFRGSWGIPYDCKGPFIEHIMDWIHANSTSKSTLSYHGLPWKVIFVRDIFDVIG